MEKDKITKTCTEMKAELERLEAEINVNKKELGEMLESYQAGDGERLDVKQFSRAKLRSPSSMASEKTPPQPVVEEPVKPKEVPKPPVVEKVEKDKSDQTLLEQPVKSEVVSHKEETPVEPRV